MKSVSRYWTQKSRFSKVPWSFQSTVTPFRPSSGCRGRSSCWKMRLWAFRRGAGTPGRARPGRVVKFSSRPACREPDADAVEVLLGRLVARAGGGRSPSAPSIASKATFFLFSAIISTWKRKGLEISSVPENAFRRRTSSPERGRDARASGSAGRRTPSLTPMTNVASRGSQPEGLPLRGRAAGVRHCSDSLAESDTPVPPRAAELTSRDERRAGLPEGARPFRVHGGSRDVRRCRRRTSRSSPTRT